MFNDKNKEIISGSFEKDISEIEEKLQDLKSSPESPLAREFLKEHIRQKIQIVIPKTDLSAKKEISSKKTSDSVFPDYLEDYPEELKLEVERLINIAWNKGIEAAVKTANYQGPFIIDAFHDALTDKLYKKFKEKGLI
ncbi:MAG: hypothetical protein KY053_01410 [Candidatus Liptonbacteria bacterium]|nr:hypothetical protein [Candidatus Liptonbacteria bacterium]